MAEANTIPQLMHFPLAKAFSVTSWEKLGKVLFIRRKVWDGATIDPDTTVAYPVKWLFWEAGLWFVWEDDGNGNGTARVAEAADMDEEDFLAWDWTTLGVGCIDGLGECSDDVTYADLTGWVRPYDLFEEVVEPTKTLNSPNAGECGNACSPGEFPPFVTQPAELGYGGNIPAEGAGAAGGSGGGSPPPPPGPGPGGGRFLFAIGGGGGGSSSGGGRLRRTKLDPSYSITISNISTDIPGCVPNPADPVQSFYFTEFDATVNDPDNPADIWFLKCYYRGVKYFDNTTTNGTVETVQILNTFTMPLDSVDHSIVCVAWKAGGGHATARAEIVMPDECYP